MGNIDVGDGYWTKNVDGNCLMLLTVSFSKFVENACVIKML